MLSGGKGGDGKRSLHREKHRPRMGPDGGDGGRGGRLTVAADAAVPDLYRYADARTLAASDGAPGGRNRRSGAAGKDLRVPVPPGTRVEGEEGALLADLLAPGDEWTIAGGKGGRGNARFATPKDRAPRKTEQGRPGQRREVVLRYLDPADTVIVSAGPEGARLHEALTRRDYAGGAPSRPMPGVRVDDVRCHERILLLPPLTAKDGTLDLAWLRQAARARRAVWAGSAPSEEERAVISAALPPGVAVLHAGDGEWPGSVPASAEDWPAP